MCDLRASLVSWRGLFPSPSNHGHAEARTDISLTRYDALYPRPCSFQLRYSLRKAPLAAAAAVHHRFPEEQAAKRNWIVRSSSDASNAGFDPNEATVDQLRTENEGFSNPNRQIRVRTDGSVESDSIFERKSFQDLEKDVALRRVEDIEASTAERIGQGDVAKENGNGRVSSEKEQLPQIDGYKAANNEAAARSEDSANVQRLKNADKEGVGVALVSSNTNSPLGTPQLGKDACSEIDSHQRRNVQVSENSNGGASIKRQFFTPSLLIDFASKQMNNVSRFFTRLLPWEQKKRLEHLLTEADNNPKDASKQAALLKELFKQSPQAVIERFERREHAANEEAVVEYIKALVVTDAIADFLSDQRTGRSSGLPALLLELKRAAGDLEEPLVPPGMTEQKPLHVVMVDSKVSNKSMRLVQELLYALFFMIVFSILWVMGTAALRKYVNGAAGIGPSSSIGASSVYSPKEFSKEVVPEKNTKTFKDVKGCDEAKEELEEIVDYLRNPTKFTRLGGKLPKGVLLVGPPGTGKTLLAKAIAGEAAVPFFYRAGSEFEEMFVGVGARRVRSLFQAAKKKAPCIVFIDEIDAVGSSRKHWEGHTKKTLNQLLVEMDGFEANEGIIVLAATNLPESLDPALIRPGRFDRHVVVTNPDVRGREEILELYMKDKPLSEDIDVKALARGTPGFSGADLANLVNMAAVKAAVDGVDKITTSQLEFAKDKLLMGTERKSMVLSEESRKLTAYHESGHAVVAFNTAGANPIHKATIMPRGTALGMVTQLPEKDETSVSKVQLMARLDVCMGGRAAEEIVFGSNQITSGARSDLQQATALARHMVSECGMSETVGPIFVDTESQRPSPEIQKSIDAEVVRLLKEAYERAQCLLKKHEVDLHNLAKALLENETLNANEVKEILQPIDQGEETLAITNC